MLQRKAPGREMQAPEAGRFSNTRLRGRGGGGTLTPPIMVGEASEVPSQNLLWLPGLPQTEIFQNRGSFPRKDSVLPKCFTQNLLMLSQVPYTRDGLPRATPQPRAHCKPPALSSQQPHRQLHLGEHLQHHISKWVPKILPQDLRSAPASFPTLLSSHLVRPSPFPSLLPPRAGREHL